MLQNIFFVKSFFVIILAAMVEVEGEEAGTGSLRDPLASHFEGDSAPKPFSILYNLDVGSLSASLPPYPCAEKVLVPFSHERSFRPIMSMNAS